MTAQLFKSNGGILEVSPLNGEEFTLEEMQELIGGFVQVLQLTDDMIMIVDEEGKYKENPQFNVVATVVAISSNILRKGDYIVGNAVVCNSVMFQ